MEYFLGIDIGTTSVKSVAFSREGKTLGESSVSYPIHHPFPGWSEQDPEQIWRAFVETVENILHKFSPDVPRLCSFSSAMHSLIAVDSSGHPISPSIIWADNRAADIAEYIHNEHRAAFFYERTGLPVHAMSPFCKLLWIKKNQPAIFQQAAKFIGIKEYVFYKLFNVYAIDISVACAAGLVNLHSKQWDPLILKEIGISTSQLSELVATDKTYSSPAIFKTLQQIPFVIGGSDGAMANRGASDEKDALVITIGTSSAARIISEKMHLDPAMRTFCYYQKENEWLIGGASNNGGIVLQWLQEDLFRVKDNTPTFLDQATSIPPGSEGLIFLPYLMGERSPIWNANAKGLLFGLQITHGQAAIIRASIEGMIFCLYDISQSLMKIAGIKKIYATGGFAQNKLGLQIIADVFNLPVRVCETIENSAWGAARHGMQVLGIPVSSATEYTGINFPDHATHTVYMKIFSAFKRLYEGVKSEY